jgi:apolipoprotein N-acyltransferase
LNRWRVARWVGALVGTSLFVAAPWIWQPLAPLVWAGVAIGLALVSGRHGWRAELTVLAAAVVAITLAFHWTPHALAGAMRASPAIGFLFALPIILWDACRLALPFWVAGRTTSDPRVAWLPAALTAVVAERFLPSVFPWKLGYSQLDWLVTVQTAALVGAEGPTFTLFATSGALLTVASLFGWPRSRERMPALAWGALGVTVINLLYGTAALRTMQSDMAKSPTIRLALVQADPDDDDGIEALRRMTRDVCATDSPPDLVVWPECSGGSYEEGLETFADEATVFRRSRDPHRGLRPFPEPPCPILLGGRIYRGFRERPDAMFQAALLVDTDERLTGSYLKRHLMPFGEYVPWADVVPELRLYFPMEASFDRGDRATVIVAGKARIGPLLCYEDMVPSAAASMVEQSANVLVALVHGAAFANPLTLEQHRLLAQSRAIENRRLLARSSSTGETCVIDATGRITARLPLGQEGVLVADVPLLDGTTLAHRLGMTFPLVCGIALVGLASGKLRKMAGLAGVAAA